MESLSPSKCVVGLSLAFAAVMLILNPCGAMGDTAGLTSFTSGATLLTTGTVGWAFTLSSTITVTELGAYDSGEGIANHSINLWTSTGTLLVSAAVTDLSPISNHFHYASVSPTVLSPGSYTISYNAQSDNDLEIECSNIVTASGITYSGSRSSYGALFPSTDQQGFSNGMFGPNFEFTPAPEPGSAMLCLGGLAVVLPRRLRSRF